MKSFYRAISRVRPAHRWAFGALGARGAPYGGIAALLVALLLGGCGQQDAATPNPTANGDGPDLSGVVLRVGAPNKIGNRPYLEAAGELENLPYRIEWSEFSATPALLEALRGGNVDLGGNGGATAIIFEAGNNDASGLRVVASGRPLDGPQDAGSAALLVRADSPYQSIADLANARLSVMKGSGTQYLLGKVLGQAGLGFDDIQLLNLSNDAALAALLAGHIDAWGIWDPQLSVLLHTRDDLRLLGWVGKREDSYAIQYASAQALADPAKRAAIEDFLTRLARATVWVAAHPSEWATLSGKRVRVDPVVMRQIGERTRTRYGLTTAQQQALEDAFAAEADYWHTQGAITRRPAIAPLFDHSFNPAMLEASREALERQTTAAQR